MSITELKVGDFFHLEGGAYRLTQTGDIFEAIGISDWNLGRFAFLFSHATVDRALSEVGYE